MQVDPIKSVLKAPGSMLLKPICDEPLSNFAFKFILRRYTMGVPIHEIDERLDRLPPLLRKVGRCRLTLSNPSRNRLELSS